MNFRRHSIILIILLAVIVRLIALHWQDTQQLTGGEDRAIAQSLIDGQGFSFQQFNYFGPTSIRPPIYPFVLFGIFSIFGSGSAGPMVAVMLNLTAAAISVAAAYRLGINLFRKRAMAQLFAILLALWPGQIVAAGYYQGLTLATCFLLLSLTMITSPRNSRAPLAGIFAGLAVMTESILLLPVAAIYLWISSLKPARAITALVATVCLIVPWLPSAALVASAMIPRM